MANQQRKDLSVLISWIIQISLQGRDSNLYMRHQASTSGRSFWKAVNRERERGREKKSLPRQQKNRARTRSRHKERTVRLTDAQDQAFKNPPGASTFKFISNISKMDSSVPSVMALKRRNFCSADVSALDT